MYSTLLATSNKLLSANNISRTLTGVHLTSKKPFAACSICSHSLLKLLFYCLEDYWLWRTRQWVDFVDKNFKSITNFVKFSTLLGWHKSMIFSRSTEASEISISIVSLQALLLATIQVEEVCNRSVKWKRNIYLLSRFVDHSKYFLSLQERGIFKIVSTVIWLFSFLSFHLKIWF